METTRKSLGVMLFPRMKKTWSKVFRTLQPDLWVGPETVCLDAHDLARVAQQQNPLPDRATTREGHGPEEHDAIMMPLNSPDQVLRALAELEADPGACGPASYRFLTGMVRRHAEAYRVDWATDPAPRQDDGTGPALTRAALLARVEALDRARGVPDAA